MANKGYTYDEAMKKTGRTRRQLEHLKFQNKIRFKNIGRKIIFHTSDIDQMAKDEWQGEEYNGK